MWFKYYADEARKNSNKSEHKNDSNELKKILTAIKVYSKQGYDGIRIKYNINDTVKNILINLGYTIYHISLNYYEIYW